MSGPERLGATARARAAEQILVQAGVRATVEACGATGEIAAVRAPVTWLAEVATHASALRELGFRYVALDLADDGVLATD